MDWAVASGGAAALFFYGIASRKERGLYTDFDGFRQLLCLSEHDTALSLSLLMASD